MTDRGKEILNKAYQQGWLSGFDFSLLIQDITISENGYVIADESQIQNVLSGSKKRRHMDNCYQRI